MVFLYIILLSPLMLSATKQYALIKVPVADLFGTKFSLEKIPVYHGKEPTPRINQALFNEVVEVTKRAYPASTIKVSWAVYDYDAAGEPENSYSVANKNLLFLTPKRLTQLRTAIPKFAGKKNSITLLRPFTHQHTTFSVGTEFVLSSEQPHARSLRVIYINPRTFMVHHADIPRDDCLEYQEYTLNERRALFVRLIKHLVAQTEQTGGVIPYVWGGSSFTQAYSDTFTQDAQGAYQRIEPETNPVCGYDCSNLILRCAHMTKLPYYFKTTKTLEKFSTPLKPETVLQDGDIIWMQGHVAVAIDVKNNLIVEASGYENGIGKVRIVPLSTFIKDIATFDQLRNAYIQKKNVMRLDARGNAYKQTPIKIFRLCAER